MNFNDLEDESPTCENPINMIPLIDIMLVLLVVFMIAMPLISTSINSRDVKTNELTNEASASSYTLTLEVKNLQELNLYGAIEKMTTINALAQDLSEQPSNMELILVVAPELSYRDLSKILNILDQGGFHNISFSEGNS